MSTTPDPLTAFSTYLTPRITLHPSIRPHRFSAHGGLGIAATAPIAAGTTLFHVPLSALLIPADLPDPPPPPDTSSAGVSVRPHAKLAAHIAFDEAFRRQHEAWLATWPTLRAFAKGMPILWPERTRGMYCAECRRSYCERECDCGCGQNDSRFAVLPSPITGLWRSSTSPAIKQELNADQFTRGLVPAQQAKFSTDLRAAQRVLAPERNWKNKEIKDRWTWAWCCVNTRSFYYMPEGKERPEDADEGMVLGPGMDLFNHAADVEELRGGEKGGKVGVRVSYGPGGFEGMAQRDLRAAEEVFYSYGAHRNDDLFVEYGFLLGENKWDGVGIDGLILPSLSSEQREALNDVGYLGECTLTREGVCWRSEAVARLLAAEDWRKWEEGVRRGEWCQDLVEGGKVRTLIKGWVEAVRSEAERGLRGLRKLEMKERNDLFVDGWKHVDEAADERGKVEQLAHTRYDLCIQRWQQILDTAIAAAEYV